MLIALKVEVPVALDPNLKPLGQGVHRRHADAVQPAGYLVDASTELATGVQHRMHNLECGLARLLVDLNGNATAIVLHGDRVVGVDGDGDVVAEAGQGLVDRVVHYLKDKVVQAPDIGAAHVHTGAPTNGLQPLQNLDILSSVGSCLLYTSDAADALLCVDLGGRRII